MRSKSYTYINTNLLFAIIIQLFAGSYVQGQNWHVEYILNGDSGMYTFSRELLTQGKPVEFFFPAYKYHQKSTILATESVIIDNSAFIEYEFNTHTIYSDEISFEADIYAKEIDTLQFFFKTTEGDLIPVYEVIPRKDYTYLPTISFTVNLNEVVPSAAIKNILITGKSQNKDKKFIIGRFNCLKKILYAANSKNAVYEFVTNYPFEKKSDTFYELPDHYLRLNGFEWYSQLVLKNCISGYDSIRCISQFMNQILDGYGLYEMYGINKKELINRNNFLAENSLNLESYYKGMKEVVASLNNCHMRLSTSKQDEIDSPLQPIYFYNINNEISVTAVFDSTLTNKIELGDKLLSINDIPVSKLYDDFSKYVFASTPHQREIKVTQKILYLAKEFLGDSLSLEFQKNTSASYSVDLLHSNFSGKKKVPSGFKIASNNVMEKYDEILYFKPNLWEYLFNPLVYTHMDDLNNCKGLIIDLRGCPGGDYSACTFLSFFIADNSLFLLSDSNQFHSPSPFIVKPSDHIQVKAPVVMIVDSRTTCAPELLVSALRNKREDIYVIGASHTAGSAQLNVMTKLPENAILTHFEGVLKDSFEQIIDNNQGLRPDSIYRFNSYKDLFPYEDMLKEEALKYFGQTIKSKSD